MINGTAEGQEMQEKYSKEDIYRWLELMTPAHRADQFTLRNPYVTKTLLWILTFLGSSPKDQFLFTLLEKGSLDGDPAVSFYKQVRVKELFKPDPLEKKLLASLERVGGIQRSGLGIDSQLASDWPTLRAILQSISKKDIFTKVRKQNFINKSFNSFQEVTASTCWFWPYTAHTRSSWLVFAFQINILFNFFGNSWEPMSEDRQKMQGFLRGKEVKSRFASGNLISSLSVNKLQTREVQERLVLVSQQQLSRLLIKQPLKVQQHNNVDTLWSQFLQKIRKLVRQDFQLSKLVPKNTPKSKPKKKRKEKPLPGPSVVEQERPQPQACQREQPQCSSAGKDSTKEDLQILIYQFQRIQAVDQLCQPQEIQKRPTSSKRKCSEQAEKPIAKSNSSSKKRKKKQKQQSLSKLKERASEKWTGNWVQSKIQELSDILSARSNKLIPARQQVFEYLKMVALSELEVGEVQLYGSCGFGMALQSSDIDMVAFLQQGSNINNFLNRLATKLKELRVVTTFIQCAKVPVVKCEIYSESLCLQVDFTAEAISQIENHSGLRTKDLVNQFSVKYQKLSVWVIALKQVFKAKKLLQLYQGGVNSYMLFLMVLAFLRNSYGKPDFRRLVHFYSKKFDPSATLIDPMGTVGCCFLPAPKQDNCLRIIQPTKKVQIGANCFKVLEVLKVFNQLAAEIKGVEKSVQQQLQGRVRQELQDIICEGREGSKIREQGLRLASIWSYF